MKAIILLAVGAIQLFNTAQAQTIQSTEAWPNFDQRRAQTLSRPDYPEAAVARIKEQIPGVQIDFDDMLGTPKYIRSIRGFLSEPELIQDQSKWPPLPPGVQPMTPQPKPDTFDHYRTLKQFLNDNTDLFGYDATILNTARITRESTTPHNQLRTVVWQQALDGISVFEAILIANFSRSDALVSLSSQVIPDLSRVTRSNAQSISAADAVALAVVNIGGEQVSDFEAMDEPAGNERKQKFTGDSLVGEAEASLVWLPMDRTTLRLCWRVVLTGKQSGKLFQVLIDAANGEPMIRHCWTSDAVGATYLVFDKDSAAPLLPGWSTPITNQASAATQVNLTLSAYSTNASPAGWVTINAALFGLTNTTFGNNVDAHLDVTNSPGYGSTTNLYWPRPIGVFTNNRVEFSGTAFTADLSQSPTNFSYRNAAVVNAFFWCNWMHDVLYDLGFNETNGNFQYDNFGRGGTNGDPVQMDVIEGKIATGQAYASPQDGGAGRIQIGFWNVRNGIFDQTVILHEYTHLMSHRLVGSGAGINQHQTEGLDEGWSDFYALALSSESTDNIRGTYQFAGFAGYKYTSPTFLENYYFGIRPYPCSIDMAKDPMTLGDLYSSPNGVGDPHPGIPLNPISSGFLNEEHAFGQVWCAALWDARANLIQQHGYTNGNWLALQLVTDGMKLGPANPTFLQARDAVLVADLAYTGGKNALELWTAFAKRGMGYYATNAPSNFMDDDGLIPVRESFTIPPFVEITNGIYSSPAIGADGTVYVGSANGRLYAISREGNIQWAFGGLTTNQPFNSSPVVGPLNVIYAGCNDSNLYALAGGALLWRTNLGGQVFSSPALATDGTIYAGSANGKLYAVNPDGTVKWSANVTSSILSSPAVALDGTVYAGSLGASNNLHAFNPTNGAVLAGWPVTVGGGVYSSPALASDGSVVVGGLDGKVYAFTAGGSARSGWPFTTGGAVYSSPAIGPDGRVYVGSSDTNLYALNPDGTTNWTYRAGGAVNSSPALGRDGTVFVGAEDGQLHVVNADGTGRWSYPVGGPVFSSPVIGLNGGLYVGSVGGNLYFLPTGTPFGDGAWPMFRQNFQHTANGRRVIIRPPQMTGGSFKFEISGPAGAACTVEATTNLPAAWSFFSTQTLTNGVGLVETGATNANRYFRAGIP